MKKTRLLILIAIVAAGMLLSACGGRGAAITSWPGLLVEGDLLYIAYNTHAYVVQADSGIERTRIPAEADNKVTFFSAPAFLGDSQMLLGAYNNSLYSYNPNTGSQNWVFTNSNRFISSPLVVGETIYATNADHNLYALNVSGTKLWAFETGDPIWASPVSDGERVYVASMDHVLYAINPASGQSVWQTDLGGTVVSSPTLGEDGTLYIGTFESQVMAIDSQNGKILWTTDTRDWVWASPAVSGETLYVADLGGTLYALNASNGTTQWQLDSDGVVSGQPLVYGESVFFATEAGSLYSVSLDGVIRWTRSIGEDAQLYSSPVASGDIIMVAAIDGDALVYAYDTNGSPQWQYSPEN